MYLVLDNDNVQVGIVKGDSKAVIAARRMVSESEVSTAMVPFPLELSVLALWRSLSLLHACFPDAAFTIISVLSIVGMEKRKE